MANYEVRAEVKYKKEVIPHLMKKYSSKLFLLQTL